MIAAARTLVLLALVAAPSLAQACPACLGNQRKTSAIAVVGAFMTVPFIVFLAVLWFIRRSARDLQ